MIHLDNAQLAARLTVLQHDNQQIRAELDQIRAQLRIAAAEHDLDEACEKCEMNIRRGEAYIPPLPGVGLYEHVYCPTTNGDDH